MTATAFLFPKTTTDSCSAHFNPEKEKKKQHKTPQPSNKKTPDKDPHHVSASLCITVGEHHCLCKFPHACMHSLTAYKSPFCSVQPCWAECGVCPGFCTGPSKSLVQNRLQSREQTVLAVPHARAASYQSFLAENHRNVKLGRIWVRLSLFTLIHVCPVLKTPELRVDGISPRQLGKCFTLCLRLSLEAALCPRFLGGFFF